MKQTAIQKAIEDIKGYKNFNKVIDVDFVVALLNTYVKMEKQQMTDAQSYAISNADMTNNRGYFDCDKWYDETYGSKGSDETLKEYHIVDTNEMVKRGTLKKRMDKDGWFVVFQSNAYNESDMAYELLKSQEIDIDMYDVYKDGDEVTFEVVNKKWAKITPFLYPFKTTSSQTEISDEEIERGADYYGDRWIDDSEAFYGFLEGAKWYREQLKKK